MGPVNDCIDHPFTLPASNLSLPSNTTPEGKFLVTQRSIMITPIVPSARVQETAGERLVLDLYRMMEKYGPVKVISAFRPGNKRASERGEQLPHVYLPEQSESSMSLAFARITQLRTFLSLRMIRTIEADLKDVELIDLQWEENALHIKALRKRAPGAKIVVTLHDVVSQSYARYANQFTGFKPKLFWLLRKFMAKILEKRILKYADEVLVLSEKDALLLARGGKQRAKVTVLPPKIEGNIRPRLEKRNQSLLFVGYMERQENQDAVEWCAKEILPLVRRVYPNLTLRVAGAPLVPELVESVEPLGVEFLGFVDDLNEEYEMASAALIPLRLGAGVKFKVVDALVRGVPVVTTPVGAEGIGGPEWFECVSDDPALLAEAVVRIIADQRSSDERARETAGEAQRAFGRKQFEDKLTDVYKVRA